MTDWHETNRLNLGHCTVYLEKYMPNPFNDFPIMGQCGIMGEGEIIIYEKLPAIFPENPFISFTDDHTFRKVELELRNWQYDAVNICGGFNHVRLIQCKEKKNYQFDLWKCNLYEITDSTVYVRGLRVSPHMIDCKFEVFKRYSDDQVFVATEIK